MRTRCRDKERITKKGTSLRAQTKVKGRETECSTSLPEKSIGVNRNGQFNQRAGGKKKNRQIKKI